MDLWLTRLRILGADGTLMQDQKAFLEDQHAEQTQRKQGKEIDVQGRSVN